MGLIVDDYDFIITDKQLVDNAIDIGGTPAVEDGYFIARLQLIGRV